LSIITSIALPLTLDTAFTDLEQRFLWILKKASRRFFCLRQKLFRRRIYSVSGSTDPE
jgi:hypothetical protein